MFQSLLNGIVSALQSIWVGITEFFSWVRDHIGVVVGMAGAIFIALAYRMRQWLETCDSLKERFTQFTGSDWDGFVSALQALDWIDRVNWIVPIDEAVFIMGILIVFILGVGFMRLLKALIY